MTRVKICGITNLEDALATCRAGADALGFVFAEEAKQRGRYVTPETAQDIIGRLPPWIATVGVCVNEPLERLRAYLEAVDWVQLCGDEPPELCQAVGPRAIKAFRTAPGFDVHAMTAYPGRAWLLDAYRPGAHGGTGECCDWALAREAAALGTPVILAGGLTPDNVAEAVAAVRPFAVDVSGGVEAAPGKKDHERIRAFVEHAKLRVSR